MLACCCLLLLGTRGLFFFLLSEEGEDAASLLTVRGAESKEDLDHLLSSFALMIRSAFDRSSGVG